MAGEKGTFGLRVHDTGFTLLEVLVAMAILATAFAAVLRLHSDSMDMVIASRAHTKALELAQYKMTEIELSGPEKLGNHVVEVCGGEELHVRKPNLLSQKPCGEIPKVPGWY